MTKKIIICVVIVVLLSLIAYYIFYYKKRITPVNKPDFNADNAKAAILEVKRIYGDSMAKIVEKMMRLETAHFTSKQYRKTGSAGMEDGKWKNLPYEMDTIEMDDVYKPGMEKFIVWRSVTDFAIYLADYINRYNGNYARWNSTNSALQAEYTNRVNSVTPLYA